jgi:glycosyltransferase involved in cell wall biosynthesis
MNDPFPRMRILLLASRAPYPVHNGEDLRIFQLARQLAARHEIHLVAYSQGGALPPEIENCFKQVHLLDERTNIDAAERGLRRIFDAFLPGRMFPFDKRVHALIRKLLSEQSFDWIWIPAWKMMPYSHALPGVRVLLDVMDDGVLELLRETRYPKSIKHLIIDLKRLLVTALFERKYFSRAQCCCLVAEPDARVLRRICPAAVTVTIPNGVDSDYFKPLGLPENYPSLVFEGNMSFGPSIDAICYFHAEVFPRVKQEIPETKLWIVGKDPAAVVGDLKADDVMVTGYVDDVRPYLDRASVFVCPMRKGAGIKNKVLQAWAMAKGVVGTPTAVAGLRARNGENILVAEDPRLFAQEIIRLLKNPTLRSMLGQNGRDTVLRHHTWEQQGKLLEERMRDL